MENTGKVFMAFAAGKETKEFEIKRYVGIAPCQVVAINPSKKELEDLFGREFEEPQYITTATTNDGKEVKVARINFVIRTKENTVCGGELFMMSMFIREQYRTNKDNTKIQVIDKYGRTAWVTNAQYSQKEIPMYSNGPAKLDKDYKPVLVGEEALIDFVKCYLGIPNIDIYDQKTGQFVLNANPSECEASFSNIKSFFTGDFKEIKELKSNNYVKILFGVRENDGKTYQAFFTDKFAKNNGGNTAIERALKERLEAGALANTTFEICELKEYKPEATNFSTIPTEVENPWGPF